MVYTCRALHPVTVLVVAVYALLCVSGGGGQWSHIIELWCLKLSTLGVIILA